eukprot:3778340-Alexandrium_andersonii.AAC.1
MQLHLRGQPKRQVGTNVCALSDNRSVWHLYIARGPKCNPQSARGPSVLQSAPIRNLPCAKCAIASG